jgi:hypothetical protein
MDVHRITVECYSGYKANERPVSFIWHDRSWRVKEIIDRWYEGGSEPSRPVLDYYKVRTEEGKIFLLMYHALFDAWTLARYRQT